jgi:hypothetical protein
MAEWTYSDPIVKGVVQVSNRNRVRSIRDHVYDATELDGGYRAFNIAGTKWYLHVAVAFLSLGSPPTPDMEVNHK